MASIVRIIPDSSASTSISGNTSGYLLSSQVVNSTDITLSAGLVVYVKNSSEGNFSEIGPADPNDITKSKVLGVVISSVPPGGTTKVATVGMVPLLMQPGLSIPDSGTDVYLSSTHLGRLTTLQEDSAAVLKVGTVISGSLLLRISDITSSYLPEDSIWDTNSSGDLTINWLVTGRVGSWFSYFSRDLIASQGNNSLSTNVLDAMPRPSLQLPDTYWKLEGTDMVPRSLV